jgi:hypothetical protein
MHARVVRFTDVTPERISEIIARVEADGPPPGADPTGLCVNEWRDRGLLVNFANLGGADPCSAEGRVGGIELKDELAAQAGWETEQGVRVDDA